MRLLDLTVAHGRTQEEARRRLETAVQDVTGRFGAMLRRVECAPDRNRVRLEGVGAWIEMWVDARDVHATGDLAILGELLGGPLPAQLRQVVERALQRALS